MFLKVLKSKSKRTIKFIILTQPFIFEGEGGYREKEEDGDEEEEG